METDQPLYEIEKARSKSFKDYEYFIFQLIKSGKLSEVIDYLEKILDFSTQDDWIKHLNILVGIGKYQMRESGQYGINYRQIIDVINYPKKERGGILFFENEEKYIEFIKEYFKNALDPFVFESNILSAALTPAVNIQAMSEDEIVQQLFSYFKNYCDRHKEVTTDFRALYQSCVEPINGGREFKSQIQAQELFVQHFRAYLKASQLNGFIQQLNPGSKEYYIHKEWLFTFFKDMDEFERYLETAPNINNESDHYKEFIDFFEKYKKNGFQPIEYKFNHLSPNRWIGSV